MKFNMVAAAILNLLPAELSVVISRAAW